MTSRSKADSRIRSRRAMSLIEVMLASLVMILVFVSSVSVLQVAFRTLDDARMTTLATQLAQSKMENLRLLNWSAIEAIQTANSGVDNLLDPTNEITTILAATTDDGLAQLNRFSMFQLEIDDSVDPDTPLREAKTLRLTIRWEGLRRETHERVFESRYAHDGLFDYDYTAFN